MAKLLLIDGNNLFHRAYHALPPLNSRDGMNSNAVFGFSNMILKAIDEVKPTHIAAAFDTKAPTFRHVEFAAYKAHRVAPPPDLYPQLPKVKAVLGAFGIKYFEKAGYEADDLLASIATKCLQTTVYRLQQKKKKAVDSSQSTVDEVVILSGDRDLLQLVNGNIKVQAPGWNLQGATLYGAREVEEKFGVTPVQMVDFKSMTGDPSDNVPGIAGIGPKTASSLVSKYGSIEGIFEHLSEIGDRVRIKLEAGRENALAAKKLVELDSTIDLDVGIVDLKFEPDWDNIAEHFSELGFKSIAAKINGSKGVDESDGSEVGDKTNSDQLELI